MFFFLNIATEVKFNVSVGQLQIMWNSWWCTRKAAEWLVWGGQPLSKHMDH